MINENKYLLQTYAYSFENLLCLSSTLNEFCHETTEECTDVDFNDYVQKVSEIIYPLLIWSVYLYGKGNHDFWWATASKMNKFFEQNKFDTLKILYNNSYVIENLVICGSRGWFSDEANQKTVGEVDWTKIVDRETARLKLSLESVPAEHRGLQKLVFLHFPPVWNSSVSTDIISLMKEHGVERCYYGHIHGVYNSDAVFIYDGIRFEMISADYLSFCPRKIII